MSHARTETDAASSRLLSWKSIGDYLGRTPRTAQRWLSEYGLPVHRLGGESGPVFAYKDELDRWLRNRGSRTVEGMAAMGPHSAAGVLSIDGEHARAAEVHGGLGLQKRRSLEMARSAEAMCETLSTTDYTLIVRRLREALDLDPDNVQALSALAFVLLAANLLQGTNHSASVASAEEAIRRALDTDPDSFDTRTAVGWFKMAIDRNWPLARRAFDVVLSYRPDSLAAALGRALLYIAEGRLAEASDLLLESATQTPLGITATLLRCWNEYLSGKADRALDLVEQARATGFSSATLDAIEALAAYDSSALEKSIKRVESMETRTRHAAPQHFVVQGVLGHAFARAGRAAEAQLVLRELMQGSRQARVARAYPLGLVYAGLEDWNSAAYWLSQSYAEGSLWSFGFRSDPLLASLRSGPECPLLFHELSYPDFQDSSSSLASAG